MSQRDEFSLCEAREIWSEENAALGWLGDEMIAQMSYPAAKPV